MRGFMADFQKGIEKDRLEHIEYVPTQVVTEYFRYLFKQDDGKIFGIKYKSAQNESGISYVIFAEQKNCVEDRLDDPDATMDALLSLDTSSVKIAHIHRKDDNKLVVGALGYWTKAKK